MCRLAIVGMMKSLLVPAGVLVLCSVWCVPASAYEYNFQITHGPAASEGGAGGGPYEPQARSSVHFRGPQPHPASDASAAVAPAASSAPVYKDEQAYASEGYHGYSPAEKSAPQYAVAQPDHKYKYAVEGQNYEPQTEIRYVSQEDASKYQQYQQSAEQEQGIKYVSAEEAHKYQQQPVAYQQQHAVPQPEKYQGYRSAEKYQQEYEAPQAQKYQSYQPAPQAEKYQAYQPAPAPEKYQAYEAPQPEKYQTYQATAQAYQAPPQHEKYQSYQADSQADKYRGYQPSAIQKYPTAEAEQKIQYVSPDQHSHSHAQYSHAGQQEEQVQYVPQYTAQHGGHHAAPAPHSYGQASAYDKQTTAYAHPVAYQYAPEAKYHKDVSSKFEYPGTENVQYVQQQQYGKAAPAPVAEKYTSSPYATASAAGQKVKFEFPGATSYEQGGDYLKSHKTHHGVAQSASVAQPVAHKYAPSAHPDLAQVAAHGASAYGHAYAGNAHPGYAHAGYAHQGYTHQQEAPAGYAVHTVHAEPQVHGGHPAALQAYQHVPHAAGHVAGQSHVPVHKATSQHSFPDHLAHGIARGSQTSPSHGHKVHDFYDDKKSAAKKSSAKKKSS